jgi:hypothetical protein
VNGIPSDLGTDPLEIMSKLVETDLVHRIIEGKATGEQGKATGEQGKATGEQDRFALSYLFYTILKKKYLDDGLDTKSKLKKIEQCRTQDIQKIIREIDLIEFNTEEMLRKGCK